ncbi:MAG TPA: hypothetical protein VN641_02235 [Urbifossiella sp.]|nr:hypothetical protein [Urbifossiella sp.]
MAPAPRPVEQAVIESSLASGGRHIRQFAFDADPTTYFATEANAGKDDHLTLRFDRPVALYSLRMVTGRPSGEETLTAAVLEFSADGSTFSRVACLRRASPTSPAAASQ